MTHYGPLAQMLTLLSTRFESYRDLSTTFLGDAALRVTDEVEALGALLSHYAMCNIDVEVSRPDSSISLALGSVCYQGKIDAAKLLVCHGARLDSDHFSITARNGQTEMLEVRFDIQHKQGDPMPERGLLLPASRFNHIATVRLLLERHPPSRAQAREALAVAERHGRAELVRTIVSLVPDAFVASDGWIERAAIRDACTP